MEGTYPTTHDKATTPRLFVSCLVFIPSLKLLCSLFRRTFGYTRLGKSTWSKLPCRAIFGPCYRAHDSIIMASHMLRPLASSAVPASATELCASSFFLQKQLKGYKVQGKLVATAEAHTN